MSTQDYRSHSFSPILVPLDGSAAAEGALPMARQLAQRLGATLLLVHVDPVIPLRFASTEAPLPGEAYQQLVDDERRLADDYLQKQRLLCEQGILVKTVVAGGEIASTLLDIINTERVRLVVMTTHGRTGLTRFALGSVADQLVRGSHVPMLLLRSASLPATPHAVDAAAEKSQSLAWHLDRVVVPLDGSDLSESVLPLVRELAGEVFHHVTLQRALPPTAAEPYRASVRKYLEAQERELRSQLATSKCEVTSRLSEGIVPSEKILDQAEEEGSLIVMATHGWGGMKRLVLGSVTNQVVHNAHVPVLVVRAGDQKIPSEEFTRSVLLADAQSEDSPADSALIQ
jgi:nucleotide-binding universal stress UspA family protein